MTASFILRPVATRMRSRFMYAEVDDSVAQVAQLMQMARIRHLPVLEHGKLAGLVSYRELLEASVLPTADGTPGASRKQLPATTLGSLMQRTVYTIAPDATLGQAAEEMLRYKLGCLPVVIEKPEGVEVVGILCENDLLEAAYLPWAEGQPLEDSEAPASGAA